MAAVAAQGDAAAQPVISEGGAVRALVDAVRNEEVRRADCFLRIVCVWCICKTKVHVKIRERIDQITLAGLPPDCQPLSAPVDKLANLKLKQKKAAGSDDIRPFPFMEVIEFLPVWATVRPAGLYTCTCTRAHGVYLRRAARAALRNASI